MKEFLESNGGAKLEHSNSSSSDELPYKQISSRIIMSEDVNNKNSPSRMNLTTTSITTTAFGGKLESVSLQSFNAMLEKLSPRNETKVRLFVRCLMGRKLSRRVKVEVLMGC